MFPCSHRPSNFIYLSVMKHSYFCVFFFDSIYCVLLCFLNFFCLISFELSAFHHRAYRVSDLQSQKVYPFVVKPEMIDEVYLKSIQLQSVINYFSVIKAPT